MTTAKHLHYSYDDYLGALRDSELRLEFWGGVIYAMAGGTVEHGALTSKVMALLDSKLPSGCPTFSSDVKIRIPSRDVSIFPDGSVVCGKVERARDDRLAIVNPGLIVEVTSRSTEDHDRGEKLEEYKRIKSLQAIWIVAYDSRRVTVVERQKKGWKQSDRGVTERLTLAAPALTIDVEEIYRVLEGL